MVAVKLNWLIERPWPKTLISLSAFGKFRVARNAKLGRGELWSAALEQPGPWGYLLLGTAFGSEEEARGACRDYTETLCAERGAPTKTWPFIGRAG